MSEYEEPYRATKNDKKRMIKDWHSLFPFLHIKGNGLVKKNLPVLVGIALDYGFTPTSYVPTFFITNLLTSSYGTWDVCQRCRFLGGNKSEFWIHIHEHEQLFRTTGGWLKEDFPDFLEDKPICFSFLIREFQKQIEGVPYPNTNVLKDLAYLNGYYSRHDEVDKYVRFAVDLINSSTQKRELLWENVKSVQEWEEKIRSECSNPDLLRERVAQRVTEAKLDKFPDVPVIVD